MTKTILNEKKNEREEKIKKMGLPSYTLLEEVLNAITHGIGVILAITAIVLLPIYTPKTVQNLVCIIIYSSTLFMLYIISTLYHSLGINRAKKVFRVLDHCSIFLLISGTYTPIAILMIGGRLGYILSISSWTIAAIGIILNWIDLKKFSKISMACYIGMGWSVMFTIKPLIQSTTSYQLTLLLIGGAAYTLGAVIYVIGKKIKYMHSLWHVFVLAGSIFHFLMIFNCVKSI